MQEPFPFQANLPRRSLSAVVDWPAPETVKHLRSFLGMANSFRSFMPAYSEMAAPLTDRILWLSKGQLVS